MCEWKFTCNETALTAYYFCQCSAIGCETISWYVFLFATFCQTLVKQFIQSLIALKKVYQSLKMLIRFYDVYLTTQLIVLQTSFKFDPSLHHFSHVEDTNCLQKKNLRALVFETLIARLNRDLN